MGTREIVQRPPPGQLVRCINEQLPGLAQMATGLAEQRGVGVGVKTVVLLDLLLGDFRRTGLGTGEQVLPESVMSMSHEVPRALIAAVDHLLPGGDRFARFCFTLASEAVDDQGEVDLAIGPVVRVALR